MLQRVATQVIDCDKPGERTHSISQGTAEEPFFSHAPHTPGKEAPTPDASCHTTSCGVSVGQVSRLSCAKRTK